MNIRTITEATKTKRALYEITCTCGHVFTTNVLWDNKVCADCHVKQLAEKYAHITN